MVQRDVCVAGSTYEDAWFDKSGYQRFSLSICYLWKWLV